MTVHDVTLRRPVARVQAGRRRKALTFIAEHAVAIALALVFLAPFAFIVLTSLMTNEQALTPDLWPKSWHLDNYVKVFQNAPMWRYLANSLMYSVLATGFMLLSSVPAAYALARLRWRGRDLAFLGVLVMMMLPPQVTIVPLYVLWARWNLTGTLWPLILPNLFGDAFSIFLIRQFLLTIPEEYADAARADGCSELRVMWKIILPLAKPGIAAAALFMFFLTWNDYFGPLLYTSENADNWTLALGLATFRDLHRVQWNLTMAATLIVMLPVIILFFFAQKAFVQGVTLTGVKG